MKVGFISLEFPEDAERESDFLFLESAYLRDSAYFEVAKRSKKFKILDNSEYLGMRVSTYELRKWAEKVQADVVVLPDLIRNDSSICFSKEAMDELSGFGHEVVLQGSLNFIYSNLKEFISLGTEIIGIPKWIKPIERVKLAHITRAIGHQLGMKLRIHLLGFNNFIDFFANPDFIDTNYVFKIGYSKTVINEFRRKWKSIQKSYLR